MAIVRTDLKLCQGYANCVVGADDYFDLGDDGIVVVLKRDIPEEDLIRVTQAARSCPVSALSIEP